MKILIIALTSLSTGEVGVGLDLADQLRPAGVECSFVVEPPGQWLVAAAGYPYTVVDPRMGEAVQDAVTDLVREGRPDLILLSDYFTYCAEMTLRFGTDPWFLDRLGLPLVPVDIYEWANTDFRAELFGESVVEISRRILTMPVVLRPVPPAHPRQSADSGALAYRACRQDDRIAAPALKREVFHSLGIAPYQNRMLLMPVSRWHHPLPEIMGHPWQRVTEWLPELIVHHLAQLPQQVHLVVVGPPLAGFERLPPDRVHLLPPCSPERFSQLIGACDTMFSFHLPSQTLMRSIFADVPGFAMRNSYPVTDEHSLWQLDVRLGLTGYVRDWLGRVGPPVHAFESWPWRLTSLVGPLLTNNTMTAAIQRGEVLDETRFVEDLTATLLDPGRRAELAAARAEYRAEIAEIPTADALVPELAERLGL